jgi:hypothetical protein
MRDLPHLGVQRPEGLEWTCGYAGLAPALGVPACQRDATWHGFVLDDPGEQIAAMMSSCDEHAPFMALTADFTHPLVHPCAIPGSRFRWPENDCYTDWDERELLGMAAIQVGATT